MSRGLGERQRLVLVALLHLEEQLGEGRWIFVPTVLQQMWRDGADAVFAERKRQADAQHAAWKQARADHLAELEARAAAQRFVYAAVKGTRPSKGPPDRA